jgi:hypothetical protein
MDERFIAGLELSRRLYHDAVRPILEDLFPRLRHAAALLGPGSEVLGYDTLRSTDHDWGPRLQLFLHPRDAENHAAQITEALSQQLPKTVCGHPTSFAAAAGDHVQHMRHTNGPVQHRVQVTEIGSWLTGHLGFDPREQVTVNDWLATPTQRLAEATTGAVFHDDLGDLTTARTNLTWYPHDLWLYLLACQWRRISQEEAFVGRCGEIGDELGSAVIAGRLTRDLMRLCLLMARRYPPYSKWLGTAFAATANAAELTPILTAALAATHWRDREHHLCRAYETVATTHNRLGIADPVDPSTRPYHDRPFQVLHAERFADALTGRITDPAIKHLPVTGAIDQFIDSTDALGRMELTRATSHAATTKPRR